jgi:hypothetical protein
VVGGSSAYEIISIRYEVGRHGGKTPGSASHKNRASYVDGDRQTGNEHNADASIQYGRPAQDDDRQSRDGQDGWTQLRANADVFVEVCGGNSCSLSPRLTRA